MGTSPTTERYTACPQDIVWAKALDALQNYQITEKDQEKGIIETDWRVQSVQGRSYGLFKREGLRDKERNQLTLTLKPLDHDIVLLKLTERRQHWGFRGGGTIYSWYPVEASRGNLEGIMNRLTTKLEEEGCFFET